MPELIIKHAQSDFISDRFLWETKDNRTKDIVYTIIITDEQILEIYIERILRDWSKGELLAVFANRNMKSPSFNANLIDHLSCHDHSYQEELANMTDNRSQDSTLLQSCFVGDPDLTRWILKHTVDDSDKGDIQHGEIDVVNKCRNNGASLLAIACEYGHTEIVEMLLEYKADINKCQTESETPLFQACKNGYAKVLDKLVNYEQT
jgi:ankyrin repeat protein